MAEKERRGRKRSCLVVIWIPYSYRQTRHLFTEAGDDNKVGSEDKLGKISRWTNYHHQYFTVPISNQSHIPESRSQSDEEPPPPHSGGASQILAKGGGQSSSL